VARSYAPPLHRRHESWLVWVFLVPPIMMLWSFLSVSTRTDWPARLMWLRWRTIHGCPVPVSWEEEALNLSLEGRRLDSDFSLLFLPTALPRALSALLSLAILSVSVQLWVLLFPSAGPRTFDIILLRPAYSPCLASPACQPDRGTVRMISSLGR
jgi:hypothetical protein